mmetsp:Transcript_23309/g.50496  ORF Transcript_23309/g.50496 Transcript_23309/m.50496 type:complete len:246 (-) Transcript_23309:43-780(-)
MIEVEVAVVRYTTEGLGAEFVIRHHLTVGPSTALFLGITRTINAWFAFSLVNTSPQELTVSDLSNVMPTYNMGVGTVPFGRLDTFGLGREVLCLDNGLHPATILFICIDVTLVGIAEEATTLVKGIDMMLVGFVDEIFDFAIVAGWPSSFGVTVLIRGMDAPWPVRLVLLVNNLQPPISLALGMDVTLIGEETVRIEIAAGFFVVPSAAAAAARAESSKFDGIEGRFLASSRGDFIGKLRELISI